MITPFADGKVDFHSLAVLCRRALVHSSGLVALGTTGEPCTLSEEEKIELVRFLREQTSKPLVVGVTGNDTAAVEENARFWQEQGADALLVLTPYYNRCTQEGLCAHFEAVCRAVDIPVVVYNVPTRTGVNVTPDTLRRLLRLPHVAGVKEASADLDQIVRYGVVCREEGKALLCGEDGLLPVFRLVGAVGVVSAAANAVPDVMAEGMYMPFADLSRWFARYQGLFDALFADVNPIGVKEACSLLGLCRNELRLPLTPSRSLDLRERLVSAGYSVENR